MSQGSWGWMCRVSSRWITWGVGSKVGEVTGGQANALGFMLGGKEQSERN